MNRTLRQLLLISGLIFCLTMTSSAQSFDFSKLQPRVEKYTVVIDLTVEISFGVHSTEQEERFLGTIVSPEGLVVFNGSDLLSELDVPALSGFDVTTEPTKIEVSTLDGRKYPGKYVGVDQYTRLAFLQIEGAQSTEFTPVEFVDNSKIEVGDWIALYMLMPEFITPSLAADVGMVSSLLIEPDSIALTVGFSPMQMTSVLFDEKLQPIGVLGTVMNPAQSGDGVMSESMGQFFMPLLGVVGGERLQKLIENPPSEGESERGWLGIRLQALTEDMAEFWGIEVSGGIIVNEIIEGSPAAESGLEVADIIFEINGEQVEINREESLPVFRRKIAELGPGANVEFAILRPTSLGLDTLKKAVELAAAPLAASDAPEYESKSFELKVRDLVFDDYMMFNQDPDQLKGVFVSEMEQGGLADVGGLSFGDIIQRINNTDIETVDQAREALELIEEQRPREVIFFVWRNTKTLFVNIKTGWE